jgi:nitrous oxide reductase accessory protein NosL
MMRRRTFILGLGLLTLALACSKTDEPVDPVWGKEPCAYCRMLVSDRRYAAQVVSDGDRRYFDDIGCMVSWLADKKAERMWVRDAVADRWIDARHARYVEGAKTPMDFGFEARTEGGVGWDEMRDKVLAKKGAR